ncbi:MAG: RsmD family RNA methyltransferase [Myxococcota bacterium]
MSVRVQIRGFSHGGEGVGQDGDGLTWFVPGAVPGEEVEVEPGRRKARWARGRLVEVIEAGPDRVAPPCGLAIRCGGCDWQHVAADRQAEHKRAIVAGQLRALVADESQVRLHEVRSPSLGYRRRARAHYVKEGGELRLGFFAPRSREVVDAPQCPVLRPELERSLAKVRALEPHMPASGEILGLSDGRHVSLALPGVRPDERVLQAGRAVLDDELVGLMFRGGRRSGSVGTPFLGLDGGDGLEPMPANPFVFSQANAVVNRALVRHVVLAARADGKRVLELYAGAGNLSRALARSARRVWTLDDDREAARLLQELAEEKRLAIKAKHGSAPNLVGRLAGGETRYDVVVVDPPRSGMGKEMSAHVARVATERVVYVSCDPATLARDLEVLVQKGLRIIDVTVFDMMPMTAQVEVVATLARAGGAASQ